MTLATVMAGDCRDELPHLDAGFFAACVTSPPVYGCFGPPADDLPDPRRRRAIGAGSVADYKCSPAWDMERPPLEPPAKFRALPEAMVQRCLSASTRSGERVLDPFAGIGTVARVAERLGRPCFSIELDPHVVRHAQERLAAEARP